MSHHFALPVATHVARREAGRSLGRLPETPSAWQRIVDEVVVPAGQAFRRGDRLTEGDFLRSVERAKAVLASLDPILSREAERTPTRTRPKGEGHEIRIVCRMGAKQSTLSIQGLAGMRVFLGRKRVEAEFEMAGHDVTGHLLERSIERDLASWNGRLREVDAALLATSGLAVVWRHAYAAEMIPTHWLAAPIGDGLMLGEIIPSRVNVMARRFQASRTGLYEVDNGRSSFHCPLVEGVTELENLRYLRTAYATAVGDDRLSLHQVDLRDALRGFMDGHAVLLAQLAEASFWRAPVLTQAPDYDALLPGIYAAAQNLAKILTRPDLHEALTRNRPELIPADDAPAAPRP